MDRSAHVTSIDSLRDLRAGLGQFGADAKEAVVMLMLESRRAVQWLTHDRSRYWPDQLRKANDWVVRARNELERCQLRYGSEHAPSCFEQKKALERAKRRVRLCEEKIKAVKRWINAVREELDDFEGELTKLTNWAEVDLPRALAALDRMVHALDKYAGDYRSLETMGFSPAAPGGGTVPAAPPESTESQSSGDPASDPLGESSGQAP